MLLGNTISETIESLRSANSSSDITYSAGSSPGNTRKPVSKMETILRFIISLLIIGIASYLLYLDNKSQVAIGLLGGIGGYWLK